MIMLSRNLPIALIVGAAGFLGSHLVEKLLSKGIQVVGVDDLSSGRKENLENAAKNKHFHFLNQDASEKLEIDLPRLDYAFFIISENISEKKYNDSLDNFLQFCHSEKTGQVFKPKVIYVSSIDLYDRKKGVSNLRNGEKKIASFALSHKANIRVIRLAAVFGPRMHFRDDDPIFRLIQAAVAGDLQKETTPLDFSTRSLYVDDCINLLIKALMHGATAQKIYDGALSNPVKVTEIRQILLDPVWYESRGFHPTELPPWPTPNLNKTKKELAWKNETDIVKALRETIYFYKERPYLADTISKVPEKALVEDEKNGEGGKEDLKEDLNLKEKIEGREEGNKKRVRKIVLKTPRSSGFKGGLVFVVGLVLVIYALIYPAVKLTLAVYQVKTSLEDSLKYVEAGDLQKAEDQARQEKIRVEEIKKMLSPYFSFTSTGVLGPQLRTVEEFVGVATNTIDAVSEWVIGVKILEESFQIVSGSKEGDLNKLLSEANVHFNQADKKLQYAQAKLLSSEFLALIPPQLRGEVEKLEAKINAYQKRAEGSKFLTLILPMILPTEDKKSYLLLFIDNNSIRPGGGLVRSYAQISFENGKLVNIETGDIKDLDKGLVDSIELPNDLKIDLGEKNWTLVDAGFQNDFPENARLLQWFYSRAKGVKTAGVVALDLQAVSNILDVLGGVSIGDGKEKVTSTNIREKAVSRKNEDAFFTEVFEESLKKFFFLENQNWASLGFSLNQALLEKHLLLYMTDPLLFSYLNSKGWTGTMPRQGLGEKGERKAFLSLSESNIEGNGVNYFLQKNIDLQTSINQNGKISHVLTVGFTNQNPNLNYKTRVKVYLSAGTRLKKASFGEKDILKEISSFTDFGRAGYSMLLLIKPREMEKLKLEYEDLQPLVFENQIKYVLDVVKQPGTGEDQLQFKLKYPQNLKLISKAGNNHTPQEISFSTVLSQDRSFEVVLEK